MNASLSLLCIIQLHSHFITCSCFIGQKPVSLAAHFRKGTENEVELRLQFSCHFSFFL